MQNLDTPTVLNIRPLFRDKLGPKYKSKIFTRNAVATKDWRQHSTTLRLSSTLETSVIPNLCNWTSNHELLDAFGSMIWVTHPCPPLISQQMYQYGTWA